MICVYCLVRADYHEHWRANVWKAKWTVQKVPARETFICYSDQSECHNTLYALPLWVKVHTEYSHNGFMMLAAVNWVVCDWIIC